MSLIITLPTELEASVQTAAAKRGCNEEQFVLEAVKRALLKPALDELLAPVRKQFVASGMSEEEFDQLIDEERQAIVIEKCGRSD